MFEGFGLASPDGSPWVLGDYQFEQNPRYTLNSAWFAMVRHWRLWQGTGFGAGPLPQAGGTLDQPARMLDAFLWMNTAERQLKGDDRADGER